MKELDELDELNFQAENDNMPVMWRWLIGLIVKVLYDLTTRVEALEADHEAVQDRTGRPESAQNAEIYTPRPQKG